jgi:hypothetical protein
MFCGCASDPSRLTDDEASAADDLPAPTKDDSESMPVVYEDALVTVRADATSPATAKAIAQRTEDAWRFDLDQLSWSEPPTLSSEPLTVLAYSAKEIATRYPGLAAGALGGDKIFVNAEQILSVPGLLAHELSHAQSSRMGGGLPHTLEEGKAVVIQRLYTHELGDAYAGAAATATYLKALTPSAADAAITEFMFASESTGHLKEDERVGALVVEFLRVKMSIPSVLPQIADCVELMSATSATTTSARLTRFQEAFTTEFGLSFSDLRDQLWTYLADTQDSPAQRLTGTTLTSTY